MKKEELLLQAIGMLPDEMAVQDLTEELLEGAASIEKDEKRHKFLHKCSYALAAAACFAVIVTGLAILGQDSILKPDIISDSGGNIIIGESNSGNSESTVDSGKYDNIKIFVYENAESMDMQKSSVKDNSSNSSGIKEVLYGKTVKLETVKETKCVVFGMDRDFYFTIPKNKGKAYILNVKSGKKRFVDGKEVLCKTGNKVYFDISGIKADKSSHSNIDAWAKEGVEAVAFADIYLKNAKKLETAGRFYIGKKEKNKAVKDKEGDVYYGFFESKNGN